MAFRVASWHGWQHLGACKGEQRQQLCTYSLSGIQLCSGVDENAVGACAELIFAPIDASFSDDAPLLSFGFRIIPLHSGTDASSPNHTLDLASALEVGPTGNRGSGDYSGHDGSGKSVMTIVFQFAFEIHLQENIAAMARLYVQSIIAYVQRVALALYPSRFSSDVEEEEEEEEASIAVFLVEEEAAVMRLRRE
ncbi:Homeobox-leucine zipper protein ATHB-15 [Camellia lanceoleosa]|uniref:Homeobox-leucine zipper protein ATHB-15 n=1 Tax=Camellia lanceoleosa TaxID=1840588 RepID=A0ACC0HPD1_9ERIC|nr:Homeobox-leucine zipper protein ATHB-15 [Camellia lanceoleosa]